MTSKDIADPGKTRHPLSYALRRRGPFMQGFLVTLDIGLVLAFVVMAIIVVRDH